MIYFRNPLVIKKKKEMEKTQVYLPIGEIFTYLLPSPIRSNFTRSLILKKSK